MLSISNVGASAITSVFWLYLAKLLAKDEFGEIGFLISVATVASAFANVGLGGTIIVYGAKKEQVFQPVFSLGLITTSVVSIFILLITQNIFLIPLIYGMFFYMIFISHLDSEKKYNARSIYRILRSILIVLFSIPLYYLLGINGILLGFALATIPSIKNIIFYLQSQRISIRKLRPKLEFMFNNWVSNLTTILFWWGDKIIIGSTLTFSLLGSYQLASQYILLLFNIPNAVFTFLLPQEAQLRNNKKIKIFSIIVSCVLILLSLILIPVALPVFFNEYSDTIIPIQIMSISLLPLTISYIHESYFLGNEKSRSILIGTSAQTIIYFVLIVVLGHNLGITGIAIGFLIANIFKSVYYQILRLVSKNP